MFVSGQKVHLDKKLKICLREKAFIVTGKQKRQKYYEPLTHAYALWAANVLLAVFAPAFPLSFHDRKFARRPPKPTASVVSGHS